jgi:flagellar export protein FliJ
MTRLEKFTRIAQMAEQRADAATLKLAERIRGVASGEAQLGELHRFRSEYESTPADSSALEIAALINRHRFLGRVDEAIAFQQSEIARQQRLLTQEQQACGKARGKARALDSAVTRIGEAAERRSERYEQGQLDERAQRSERSWDAASNDGDAE